MNLIAAGFTTNARAQLIERLWLNTQISREQIFGSADRLPHGGRSDARDMWPGYVGPKYRPGGLVLVANFPAGGTVAYADTARAARDGPFYELISAFKRANSVSRAAAFEALNRHVAETLPQWGIYRIVRVVLEAAGVSLDEVAYINLVPYRIADNNSPTREGRESRLGQVHRAGVGRPTAGHGRSPGQSRQEKLWPPEASRPCTSSGERSGTGTSTRRRTEAARQLAAARGAPTPAGDAARKPQASVANLKGGPVAEPRPSAATSKLRGSGLGRRSPRPIACTG